METFCNECERTDVKPPGRHTCDLCCGITVGSEKDQRDAFDDMEVGAHREYAQMNWNRVTNIVFRSPAGGKMKRHTQQVVANVIGLRITLDLELSFTSIDV